MNLDSNNTTLGVKMRTNICQTNIGTGGVGVVLFYLEEQKVCQACSNYSY